KVGQPHAAAGDLGKVMPEPAGERGVEIENAPLGIGREEAGRSVVQIVDGALQLAEDTLLARALAADIGDAPQRAAGVGARERRDAHTVPAPAVLSALARPSAADFLDGWAAGARGLAQSVHRLGGL